MSFDRKYRPEKQSLDGNSSSKFHHRSLYTSLLFFFDGVRNTESTISPFHSFSQPLSELSALLLFFSIRKQGKKASRFSIYGVFLLFGEERSGGAPQGSAPLEFDDSRNSNNLNQGTLESDEGASLLPAGGKLNENSPFDFWNRCFWRLWRFPETSLPLGLARQILTDVES